MMPRHNKNLAGFLLAWMQIKNVEYGGNAGLQLSINSTAPNERAEMFGGSALSLEGVASTMRGLVPRGRKITLNFAVADYEIDPDVLLRHFSPEHYLVKLTPMHRTDTAVDNAISTRGDYTDYLPYEQHESALKAAGYDVIVFIASEYEDLGRITCGNALLAGTMPHESVPYTIGQR